MQALSLSFSLCMYTVHLGFLFPPLQLLLRLQSAAAAASSRVSCSARCEAPSFNALYSPMERGHIRVHAWELGERLAASARYCANCRHASPRVSPSAHSFSLVRSLVCVPFETSKILCARVWDVKSCGKLD